MINRILEKLEDYKYSHLVEHYSERIEHCKENEGHCLSLLQHEDAKTRKYMALLLGDVVYEEIF